MDEDGEVMLSEFEGEVEVTVGAVVSISKKLILNQIQMSLKIT